MADPKAGWVQVEGAGAIPVANINEDISGAASSTLGSSPQDSLRIAQQRIQQINQARMAAAGGGLTTGSVMSHPNMPLPPIQSDPSGAVPQGPFASVGSRKRADTQAAFGTIAKIVNTAQNRLYEKKVQTIQHDFETFQNALQGYNEGKASGNQEMMDHNADIMNKLAMDPKKNKEFAKAFDVNMNPMAEGKSKGKDKPNPGQDAIKNIFAKDAQAYAKKQTNLAPQTQAIMRSMPQQLQADPRFTALLEATKAGYLTKAGEELTFQKDMTEIQQKIATNKFTNETKNKVAAMFTAARDRATMASLYRTAMTIQGAKERMDTLEKMWADRSTKIYNGIHEKNEILKSKVTESGDAANAKRLSALINGLDKTADSLNKQLEDARKAHDVTKMGEISQKLESLGQMQQLANAEAARQLKLDPEDFNQDQIKMDEETMRGYEALFPDPPSD